MFLKALDSLSPFVPLQKQIRSFLGEEKSLLSREARRFHEKNPPFVPQYSPSRRTIAALMTVVLAFLFVVPRERIGAQTFKKYDESSRADIERFMNRAERMDDRNAWTNYVELGIATERIEWEDDARDELYERFQEIDRSSGLSADQKDFEKEQAETLHEAARVQWEAASLEHFLAERGSFTARKEAVAGVDITEKEYDTIVAAAEAETKDLAYDLSVFQSALGKGWDPLAARFELALSTSLNAARTKNEGLSPEEKAAFEAELAAREKEIRSEFEIRDAFFIKRAENRYIAVKRADDASAKLAADQASADAVGDTIIEDTQNELDLRTESALNTAVEAANNTLTGPNASTVESTWQTQMEGLIETGLRKWEKAEEDLYAQRLAWMEEAKQTREDAENLWKNNHEKLKAARDLWLKNVEQQILDGRTRWEQKVADFERSREVAERELSNFIASEQTKWAAGSRELAEMVRGGGTALLEAKDAYRYYADLLKVKGVPTDSDCASPSTDDLKLRCFYREQRDYMGQAITRFQGIMVNSRQLLTDSLHSDSPSSGLLADRRIYIDEALVEQITGLAEGSYKNDLIGLVTQHQEEDFLLYQRDLLNLVERNNLFVARAGELAGSPEFKFTAAQTIDDLRAMLMKMDVKYSDHRRELLEITDQAREGLDEAAKLAAVKRDIEAWFAANNNENVRLKREVSAYFRDGLGGYFLTGNDADPYLMTQAEYEWELLRRERNYLAARLRRSEEVKRYADLAARHEAGLELAAVTEERRAVAAIRADLRELSYRALKGDLGINPLAVSDPAVRRAEFLRLLATKGIDPAAVESREARLADERQILSDISALSSPTKIEIGALLGRIRDFLAASGNPGGSALGPMADKLNNYMLALDATTDAATLADKWALIRGAAGDVFSELERLSAEYDFDGLRGEFASFENLLSVKNVTQINDELRLISQNMDVTSRELAAAQARLDRAREAYREARIDYDILRLGNSSDLIRIDLLNTTQTLAGVLNRMTELENVPGMSGRLDALSAKRLEYFAAAGESERSHEAVAESDRILKAVQGLEEAKKRNALLSTLVSGVDLSTKSAEETIDVFTGAADIVLTTGNREIQSFQIVTRHRDSLLQIKADVQDKRAELARALSEGKPAAAIELLRSTVQSLESAAFRSTEAFVAAVRGEENARRSAVLFLLGAKDGSGNNVTKQGLADAYYSSSKLDADRARETAKQTADELRNFLTANKGKTFADLLKITNDTIALQNDRAALVPDDTRERSRVVWSTIRAYLISIQAALDAANKAPDVYDSRTTDTKWESLLKNVDSIQKTASFYDAFQAAVPDSPSDAWVIHFKTEREDLLSALNNILAVSDDTALQAAYAALDVSIRDLVARYGAPAPGNLRSGLNAVVLLLRTDLAGLDSNYRQIYLREKATDARRTLSSISPTLGAKQGELRTLTSERDLLITDRAALQAALATEADAVKKSALLERIADLTDRIDLLVDRAGMLQSEIAALEDDYRNAASALAEAQKPGSSGILVDAVFAGLSAGSVKFELLQSTLAMMEEPETSRGAQGTQPVEVVKGIIGFLETDALGNIKRTSDGRGIVAAAYRSLTTDPDVDLESLFGSNQTGDLLAGWADKLRDVSRDPDRLRELPAEVRAALEILESAILDYQTALLFIEKRDASQAELDALAKDMSDGGRIRQEKLARVLALEAEIKTAFQSAVETNRDPATVVLHVLDRAENARLLSVFSGLDAAGNADTYGDDALSGKLMEIATLADRLRKGRLQRMLSDVAVEYAEARAANLPILTGNGAVMDFDRPAFLSSYPDLQGDASIAALSGLSESSFRSAAWQWVESSASSPFRDEVVSALTLSRSEGALLKTEVLSALSALRSSVDSRLDSLLSGVDRPYIRERDLVVRDSIETLMTAYANRSATARTLMVPEISAVSDTQSVDAAKAAIIGRINAVLTDPALTTIRREMLTLAYAAGSTTALKTALTDYLGGLTDGSPADLAKLKDNLYEREIMKAIAYASSVDVYRPEDFPVEIREIVLLREYDKAEKSYAEYLRARRSDVPAERDAAVLDLTGVMGDVARFVLARDFESYVAEHGAPAFIAAGKGHASLSEYWAAYLRDRHTNAGYLPPADKILERFALGEYQRMRADASAAGGLWKLDERNYFVDFQNTILLAKLDHFATTSALTLTGATPADRLTNLRSALDTMLDADEYAVAGKSLRERLLSSSELDRFVTVAFAYLEAGGGPGNTRVKELYLPDVLAKRATDGTLEGAIPEVVTLLPADLLLIPGFAAKDYRVLAGTRSERLLATLAKIDVLGEETGALLTDAEAEALIDRAGYSSLSTEIRISILSLLKARSTAQAAAGAGSADRALQIYRQNRVFETLFQTKAAADDVRVFLAANGPLVAGVEEKFFAELEKSHSDLRRLAKESRGVFFAAVIGRLTGTPNSYESIISQAGLDADFVKLTTTLRNAFNAQEEAHLAQNAALYQQVFDLRSGQELVTSGIFEGAEAALLTGLLRSRTGGPVPDSILTAVRSHPNAALRALIKHVYSSDGLEPADAASTAFLGSIPGLADRIAQIALGIDPSLRRVLLEEKVLVDRFLTAFQESDADRDFWNSVLSDPTLTQPGAHLSIDLEAQKARLLAENEIGEITGALAATLKDHERSFVKDQERFAHDTEIGRRLASFAMLRGDDLGMSRWGHFRTFIGSERGYQEADHGNYLEDNPTSPLDLYQFHGGLVLEGKAVLSESDSGADAARNFFTGNWRNILTSDLQTAARTVRIETEPGVFQDVEVTGLKTLTDARTRKDRFTSGGVVNRQKMMESIYYEGLANNYIDAVSKLNKALSGVFAAGKMALGARQSGGPTLAERTKAVYDANAGSPQSLTGVEALKMEAEGKLAANNEESARKKADEAAQTAAALDQSARDFASAGRRQAMLSMSEAEYKAAYLDPAAKAFKAADDVVRELQSIASTQRDEHARKSTELADLMNRMGDAYRAFTVANEEAQTRQAVSDFANTPYQDAKDAESRYQLSLAAYQSAQSRLADAGFRVKTQDSLLVLDTIVRGLAEAPPKSYAILSAADTTRLGELRNRKFKEGTPLSAEEDAELAGLTEREMYNRYRTVIEARADYIRETARMVRIHKANEIIQAEVERRRIEAEERKNAFEAALDAKMYVNTAGKTIEEKKALLVARNVTYQRILMVQETGGSQGLFDEFRSWFFLGPSASAYGNQYAGGFFQNTQLPNVTPLQIAEFLAGTARANAMGSAEKASVLTFLANGGRPEEFSSFVPQYYAYLLALGGYDNAMTQQGITFGTWMPVYSASLPAIQMYTALERLSSRLGPVAGVLVRALMGPLSALVSLGILAQQRMTEATFQTMAATIAAATASQNVWSFASAGSLDSVRAAQASYEAAQARLDYFTKTTSIDVLKARVNGFGSMSSDQLDQNEGRADDDFLTENLYGLLPGDLDGILTTLDLSGQFRESDFKDALGRAYNPDTTSWRSDIPITALSNGVYLHDGVNYTKIIDPDTGAVRFAPLVNGTGVLTDGQARTKSYNAAEIMDMIVAQGDRIREAAKKKYFDAGNAVAAAGDRTFILAEREKTIGALLADAGADKNGGLEYSGYNLVFVDYDENVQEIFQKELSERVAVQRKEWDLRQADLTQSRADWEDRVGAVLARGRKAWSASEDRFLAEWRKWEREYDRDVEAGKAEWNAKIKVHFAAKDAWEKKIRDTTTSANVNEIMGSALDDLDNQIAGMSTNIGVSFNRTNKTAAIQSMIDSLRAQEPSGTERLGLVNRNIEKFSTLLAVSELTATKHFTGSPGLLRKFQEEMSAHRSAMRVFTGAKMMEEYQKLRDKMIAAIEEENRQTENQTTAEAFQAGFSKQGSRFVKRDARGLDVGFVDAYSGFDAKGKFEVALGANTLKSTAETIEFLKKADEVEIESYFKTLRLKTQYAYETVMGKGTREQRRTAGESDARTHGTAGLWIGRGPGQEASQTVSLLQQYNPGALGSSANNPYLNLALNAGLAGGFGELGSARIRPGGSPLGFYLQLSAISAYTNVVNQRTMRRAGDMDVDVVMMNQLNPAAALANAYHDVKVQHDMNHTAKDAGRKLNGHSLKNSLDWKRAVMDPSGGITDAYLNSSESGRLWKGQLMSMGKGALSSVPGVGVLVTPLEVDMEDGSTHYSTKKDRTRDQMIGSFLGPYSSAYAGGFEYDANGNRTNDGWSAEGRRGDEMALRLSLANTVGLAPVVGGTASNTLEALYKKNNWHDDTQYRQLSHGMNMEQLGAMGASVALIMAGAGQLGSNLQDLMKQFSTLTEGIGVKGLLAQLGFGEAASVYGEIMTIGGLTERISNAWRGLGLKTNLDLLMEAAGRAAGEAGQERALVDAIRGLGAGKRREEIEGHGIGGSEPYEIKPAGLNVFAADKLKVTGVLSDKQIENLRSMTKFTDSDGNTWDGNFVQGWKLQGTDSNVSTVMTLEGGLIKKTSTYKDGTTVEIASAGNTKLTSTIRNRDGVLWTQYHPDGRPIITQRTAPGASGPMTYSYGEVDGEWVITGATFKLPPGVKNPFTGKADEAVIRVGSDFNRFGTDAAHKAIDSSADRGALLYSIYPGSVVWTTTGVEGATYNPGNGEFRVHPSGAIVAKSKNLADLDFCVPNLSDGSVLDVQKTLQNDINALSTAGNSVVLQSRLNGIVYDFHFMHFLTPFAGDKVNPVILGPAGSTGSSTGSHMHLEIRTQTPPAGIPNGYVRPSNYGAGYNIDPYYFFTVIAPKLR